MIGTLMIFLLTIYGENIQQFKEKEKINKQN